MKARDDLFELIQKLSPTEKKLIGSKEGKHKYHRLFAALNGLSAYDEQAFLKSPKGSEFASNYAVSKNELYEKILHVVRTQRQSAGTSKPVEVVIRERLEDLRFLREKKLNDQLERRLFRAKEDAQKHQLHELLLEILRIERTVLLRNQPAGYMDKLEILHDEIDELAAVIQNKVKMLRLYDQFFWMVRQQRSLGGSADLVTADLLIEQEELQNVGLCKSFEAESNYYFCHTIYNYLHNRPRETWEMARTLYLRWQEHKFVQKAKPLEFRNVLQIYLTFCNFASQYDDFDVARAQLMRGPFQTEEEEATAVDNDLHVNMQRCMDTCDWEGAKKVIADFSKSKELIAERLLKSRTLMHYLSFSRLHLVLREWKDAMKWVKRILDVAKSHEDLQYNLAARIQGLMALLGDAKAGDFDNFIRGARRMTQKEDAASPEQIAFVNACAKLYAAEGSQERISICQNLLEEVNQKMDGITRTDDFLLEWIQAESEGLTIQAVLEQRLKARKQWHSEVKE